MSKITRKKSATTRAVSKPRPAATKSPAKKVSKTASKKTTSIAANKAVAPAPKSAAKTSKASAMPALAEGDRAPAFSLPRDGDGAVALKDYAGRKLVLFFYPRADTPGCTREAIDFTRLKPDFDKADTAVIGMSADAVKAQTAFRDKHKLTVPLVSDETQQALNAYGVWDEKSMYGKTFMGVVRTTVLIGKDGRIAKIWRNVKVEDHAGDVLAAARAL